MGTYIVDILAMTFCFPMALFPALAEMSGGPTKLGPLYSAISVGSLVASIFSAWTYRQRRHGALVIVAAGFADMISYMTGPLLGNTMLGYLASVTSPQTALMGGAILSLGTILLATFWLKPFWRYQAAERDLSA